MSFVDIAGSVASRVAHDALTLSRGPNHVDGNKLPPVAPTPVSERQFDASDLYGPSGSPSGGDIEQNSLGDCFFVATAGAVANANPGRIENAIQYDEQTGNFTVTLYRSESSGFLGLGSKTVAVEVQVSQAEVLDNFARGGGSRGDNNGGNGPIWPALMEVAAAKLRDSNHADGLDQGYNSLGGGGKARDAMFTLTGSKGDNLSRGAVLMHGMEQTSQTIQQALTDGRPVTLSTDPEHNASSFSEFFGGQDAPQDGLVDNHVYIVEGIHYDPASGEATVTLRNPWDQNSAASVGETTPANNESAVITVSLNDIAEGQGLEYFNIGEPPANSGGGGSW